MPHFPTFKAGFKLGCIFLLLIALVLRPWLRHATPCVVYPHRFPINITIAPIIENCQFLAPVAVIASLALNLSIIHTEWGSIHEFQAGCYGSYCYRVTFHNDDSGRSGKGDLWAGLAV
jgi:hypothetical protein